MTDSLGDRMKEYEDVTRNRLVRRMPAILRLDGKAFHTLTRNMQKPFDQGFQTCMRFAALNTLKKTQTAVFAYSQSDEISILLRDYSLLTTEAYFGGQVQKIVSVSAATCSNYFNETMRNVFGPQYPSQVFDARVFNVPKEDVCNYFIWRQKDASRNSINSLGQAHFSHAELQNKSQSNVLDMLHEKGIDWNHMETTDKRGFCIERNEGSVEHGISDAIEENHEIPIFTEEREYIEKFVYPELEEV